MKRDFTSTTPLDRLGYAVQWRRRESNPRYRHTDQSGLLGTAPTPRYRIDRRIPRRSVTVLDILGTPNPATPRPDTEETS